MAKHLLDSEYSKLFELMAENPDVGIGEVREDLGRSLKTVARAYHVARHIFKFKRDAESLDEEEADQIAQEITDTIGVSYEISAHYVEGMFRRYLLFRRLWEKRSQPIALDKYRHTDRLIDQARQIRERIVNPRQQRYKYSSTWRWLDQDWRLSPTIWFRVMTPPLDSDDLWDPPLRYLEAHTKGASFWLRYGELKDQADRLEESYRKIVQKLGEQDAALSTQWADLQEQLTQYATKEWEPRIEPWTKIEPLPYSPEVCEEMLRVLAVPGLDRRLREMNSLLQQLWDDLDPEVVIPLIEQGTCERCSE